MKRGLLVGMVWCVAVATTVAQDYALRQLENSPRHHEWVSLDSQGRSLQNFVAYPESGDNVPVVIVIHENRGLNLWARSFADQVAEKGFIAIAPDLLSHVREGIEKTDDFESSDAARSAIYELDPDGVTEDLRVVLRYAERVNGSNGKIAVVGFCWGGSQSFRFATNAGESIDASFVFYGTAPDDPGRIADIAVPVYGFYGGEDQRVNATIPQTETLMQESGKRYRYEIYDGAGHAFMRRGDDPEGDAANREARDKAWVRLVELLSAL